MSVRKTVLISALKACDTYTLFALLRYYKGDAEPYESTYYNWLDNCFGVEQAEKYGQKVKTLREMVVSELERVIPK